MVIRAGTSLVFHGYNSHDFHPSTYSTWPVRHTTTTHTQNTQETHCAAAGGSTGCIWRSSPSLSAECRQTALCHVAASCCISPSCQCAPSRLASPSSSPHVVWQEQRLIPCLFASLTLTHLSKFLEWSHPLSPPSAPPSCHGYLHTFICYPLATQLKIETCRICIFSSSCQTNTAQKEEPL